MIARPRLGFLNLRWCLIPAIATHNFEEWLTFPNYAGTSAATMERLGFELHSPVWAVTQLALIIVTIVPVLLIVSAAIGANRRWKTFIICIVASIFLVNAFIPHIISATAKFGYTPGLITAVAINLPLCLAILRSAAREHWLTSTQTAGAIVFGTALLVPSIAIAILMSDTLLSIT